MTRPILHRQISWTDAKAYAPDLYASLAAVTLPDSGKPSRGTASKATDLTWANASHRAGRASPEPQERLGHSATIDFRRSASFGRRGFMSLPRGFNSLRSNPIAFAIDALMWAVFAGCFLLIVSGAL